MHRTFSVPRLVAWWSTFAALFLQIGISAASAQSLIPSAPVAQSQQTAPQNSVIELAVGASRPYQMTTRADFKRVENPNSKVLRVERSGDKNNEVILVAENPGRTIVTFVDQQDRVELHEIVVQPNGEQPKTADTPGVLTLVTGVPRTYQAREPYSAIVSRDSKKLRAQVVKPGPGAKGFEEFILEGLEPGRASFTIFFGDKKERQETYEVLIEADRVRQLRELIAKTLPTAAITVTSADSSNTIVLTGTVLTTDDLRLVQNIVANMGAGIVNNVRIGGVQQVQLEVVVAIVNRTEARRMAFSWITALIKARGGSMAVYSVAERAEGGTVRLTIDPPSAMPQSPTLAGSIFEQRRAAARYRAELQRWLAGESARQEKASGVIRTFEAQLAPALLSQRNEKRSDVWNAVLRLDRYWAEAMPLSGYAADPYGLIVSDLQHTAGGQRYTLSSNPRVAWVYRAAKRPPIFDAPQIFESVEPAVAWIVSQAAASHNGAAIGKK